MQNLEGLCSEQHLLRLLLWVQPQQTSFLPCVADEVENAQIEEAKRISLKLNPSSEISQADIVYYRY